MTKIAGAIFPVPSNLIGRILDEKRDVFIKHPTLFKELKPGDKILFYASGEIRAIVGEATIKKIEFMTGKEALEKYGRRLFIDEKELRDYSKPLSARKGRGGAPREIKYLVLELENIRRYKKPYKPKRFITVGGKYLTESEYKNILSQVE